MESIRCKLLVEKHITVHSVRNSATALIDIDSINYSFDRVFFNIFRMRKNDEFAD
jgi:hypothetical protein